MAQSNYEMIKEWHLAFDVPVHNVPQLPPGDRMTLRCSLINEESGELFRAMYARDLIEVADGLADLLYVTYGTAAEYGIPIDAVYAEVHRSNMAKLGPDGVPIYREDGKVLKPPGWTPPDIRTAMGVA